MVKGSNETVAVRLKISGRVQGVFFRAETVQAARNAGVVGWVRNCRDGTVEAELLGSRQGVAAVIAWCRHGPALAQVDNLKIEYFDPDDIPASFDIRY